ncbi:MAG: DUF5665 domain-containing protein [Deltaproteobacteria bacterium]
MQKSEKDEKQINKPNYNNVCEYQEFLEKPVKVLWTNFIRGVASGLGMAIGFTILGALVLYLLKSMVNLNLPLIGQYIAELVKIVQENMNK